MDGDGDHTFMEEEDEEDEVAAGPSTLASTSDEWGSFECGGTTLKPDASKSMITVGRANPSELKVKGGGVSKQHFTISRGTHELRDLSRNGTYINGRKIEKDEVVRLKDGDVITMGKNKAGPVVYRAPGKAEAKGLEPPVPTEETLKRKREEAKELDEAGEEKKVKKARPTLEAESEFESNCQCTICHDLMYVPASCMPCMHSFCGACISDWIKISSECPQCRETIECVSRNHTLMSMVNLYLAAHPEKERSDEEKAEMDALNTITNVPKKVTKPTDDDDVDDSELDEAEYIPAPPLPRFFPRCPQCPPGQAPDGFICDATRPTHITCCNCRTLMPDRDLPNIRCKFCSIPFCNDYLSHTGGCPRSDDRPYMQLKDFKDLQISEDSFSKNTYEQGVFTNYCMANGVTFDQIWGPGLEKMEAGTLAIYCDGIYVGDESGGRKKLAQKDTWACKACATLVYDELCYLYRLYDVDTAKLPPAVVARENCCHAERRNHVCVALR
ncbi:hypothetical protein HK101_008711 [Irineochytrium annulatum]|nr:hypothetical protein HK101_008711 [Irineochytrium annulatum]